MKKKLFVWAYTHNPSYMETCALTEDGKMLFIIHSKDHKATVDLVFKDNTGLQTEYDIIVKVLEAHMYEGAARDTLREDFRIAWDKYKLGTDALS